MDELIAFVTARLDEEERDARTCCGTDYQLSEDGGCVQDADHAYLVADLHTEQDGPYIARQDPRATLARVEALRALVDGWVAILPADLDGVRPDVVAASARDDLEVLARVWAWHEDYRQEWRP